MFPCEKSAGWLVVSLLTLRQSVRNSEVGRCAFCTPSLLQPSSTMADTCICNVKESHSDGSESPVFFVSDFPQENIATMKVRCPTLVSATPIFPWENFTDAATVR